MAHSTGFYGIIPAYTGTQKDPSKSLKTTGLFSRLRSETPSVQRSSAGDVGKERSLVLVTAHPSTNPPAKSFPPAWEVAARFITAGAITGSATIYAAWSNQLKLNPGLNAPFGRVFRDAAASQSVMKGSQLGLYIGLQNYFTHLFPENKRTATAVAYCTAATSTQGFIYTMATRAILRVAGRPIPPLKPSEILENLRVAVKPTMGRELGSTASAIAITKDVEDFLSTFLPEKMAKVLGAPFAAILCGLGTQGIHNVALTESRHFAEGKKPSTITAAKEVVKTHGWHALYKGFFPARMLLIIIGTVSGSKILGPVKAE